MVGWLVDGSCCLKLKFKFDSNSNSFVVCSFMMELCDGFGLWIGNGIKIETDRKIHVYAWINVISREKKKHAHTQWSNQTQ